MKEYLKGINKKNNLTFFSLSISSFLSSLIVDLSIHDLSIDLWKKIERMKRNNHSILFSSSILSLY